jgi:hypothetical protein
MNAPNPTKRLFTRIHFEANALLNTFPGKYECKLVDISLKGALVERRIPWQETIGQPCSLFVKLARDGTSIQMAGEIAHVEEGRLGIRCSQIALESITNLRRLVELNLGDEAQLNREIHTMVLTGNQG